MSKNKKMLLSIPVVFIVMMFFLIILDSFAVEENYVSALSAIFISFVLAAYALRLYFREFIDSVHRIGRRSFILMLVIGSLLALSCNVLGGVIRVGVTGELLSENQEALNATAAALPFLAFIMSVVCAPIVEEIIFRYILQGWLREKIKKGGAIFAVLISGTLFAVLHIGTLADMIQYLLAGLLLGVIYERTRCISLTIGIHSVNNLVAHILQSI